MHEVVGTIGNLAGDVSPPRHGVQRWSEYAFGIVNAGNGVAPATFVLVDELCAAAGISARIGWVKANFMIAGAPAKQSHKKKQHEWPTGITHCSGL